MRILQVITDTDRRGAQVFALDLQQAMQARGHSVETVALAPGTQRTLLDVQILGGRPRSPSTILRLRGRMSRADITIAHGSSTGLACALTGRKFVYRQISDSRFWANTWSRRLRVARYLRRASRIVSLSNDAKATLTDHLWIPQDTIVVVPNGVPGDSFAVASTTEVDRARHDLGIDSGHFVALYIGALVPEKGVDIAIQAVSRLTDVTLVIAGDGPDRNRLELLATTIAAGRVKFLGVATNPKDVYDATDAVILVSLGGDSMPATLIEAGMCGLPSIATAVGSIDEVVLDGTTGIIVPCGDVEALVAALGDLAGNPDLRRDLGRAARVHCLTHFEIDVVARQWLTVLAAVLNREGEAQV